MSELDKYGDMFDGMTDAELGDDASFEQLFSRMKFMKGNLGANLNDVS